MSSKPRNFARILPGEQASLPITMDLELKGKAAVITGGSVVIGSAAAEDLAVEGVIWFWPPARRQGELTPTQD